MEFNKTKRNIEKVAGIIGTVIAAIAVFGCLFVGGIGGAIFGTRIGRMTTYSAEIDRVIVTSEGISIAILLLPLIVEIPCLIFCAKIIKSPLQEDGTVKDRNILRIFTIIFAFLTGQWVVSVLEIVVMCLSDFKDPNKKKTSPLTQYSLDSLDAKIAKLKELKELGVIDEAQYKKAIERITSNL